MSELRHTTIFRALHRPNLIMGAERELVLIALILCAGIGVMSMTIPAALICTAVWLAIAGPLRMMAKADPWMSKVYLRYVKQQSYYAPRSRPWRST